MRDKEREDKMTTPICNSIKGRREPHAKPICLDGKLVIGGIEK
jgi:hypothetical protein